MELLQAGSSILVVVDIQGRLAATIPDIDWIVETTRFLVDIAIAGGVPTIATEQHPDGLGPTVPALRALLLDSGLIIPKLAFSAVKEAIFLERILEAHINGRHQVILCGLEAHICVLQTAIELTQHGFDVAVVADAVGARRTYDGDIALDRLTQAGVQIVTADMVAYEWLERAGTDRFRSLLPLLRNRG